MESHNRPLSASAAKTCLNRILSFCHSAVLDLKELALDGDTSGCRVCGEKTSKGQVNESSSAADLVSQFALIRSRFCSHICYRYHLRRKRNKSYCLFPDCNKPCYYDKESNELKDYCGISHAIRHKQMLEAIWVPCSHHSLSYSKKSGRQAILFYDSRDPYYEFTNFSHYSVVIDGVLYPTTEHYFQSQKLIGTPYCSRIAALSSPREAFEYPRQQGVRNWVRKDWGSVKDDVMYRALFHKFTQHDNLRILLLMTDDLDLIEHSPYDSYWGDGPDGKGLNKLGELLMDLRHFLRVEIEFFNTDIVSEHSSENDADRNTDNPPSSGEEQMETDNILLDDSARQQDNQSITMAVQPKSSEASDHGDINGRSSLRLNEAENVDQVISHNQIVVTFNENPFGF